MDHEVAKMKPADEVVGTCVRDYTIPGDDKAKFEEGKVYTVTSDRLAHLIKRGVLVEGQVGKGRPVAPKPDASKVPGPGLNV